MTYSPKVFIPLTMLCRDRCGYCTFAKAPAHLVAPFLTIDEVVAIARRGAELGCHEALFTLGEAPEDASPIDIDLPLPKDPVLIGIQPQIQNVVLAPGAPQPWLTTSVAPVLY